MSPLWQTLLTAVASAVLSGGLLAAYVQLRRLPGQRRIDAATHDSMISAAAAQVVEMTAAQLHGCQQECAALRARLDTAERRAVRLERRVEQMGAAMRLAGVTVPPAPR